MSKPKGLPASRNKIKLRGQMHTATARGGVLIMKKWPSVPPQIYSDARLASARAFSWACWVTRYAIDLDLISAKKYSQNTLYLPRDLLIMAMYGTLVQVTMRDGTRLWSVRKLSTEIQALLDQLSTEIGTIITRGADGWIAISPGVDGDVLTTHGAGKIPNWQPASGGGGGGLSNVLSLARQNATTSTVGRNCKGNLVIPTRTVTLQALQVAWGNVFPATVRPIVARLSGLTGTPTIVDMLLDPAVTLNNSPPTWSWMFTLSSPLTLISGDPYFIGLVRTDGSTSTAAAMKTGINNEPAISGPFAYAGTGYMTNLNPSIGDSVVISTADGNPYGLEAYGTWTP